MTKADAQSRPSHARGEATRAALLAAAGELIPEVGWGSVTTRSVAQRAGVRPGLVHYHFDSVEALLVAAATGVSSSMVAEALHTLDTASDPAEGVDAPAGVGHRRRS